MLRLRDFMTKGVAPKPAPEAPAAASRPEEKPAVETPPGSPAALAETVALRPSLAEAEKPAEPPRAAVVNLVQMAPGPVEARSKIASLSFRAPVFSAPRPEASPAHALAPAAAPAPAAEPAQEKALESVASAPVAATLVSSEPAPAAAASVAVEAEPARAPGPMAAAPSESPEPALLSPASGAKIGASFEALAESLLMRDPLMLERMTREMLRPMLKAWLDDNLPIVVERLVRAEIERVARGRG